MEIYFLTKLKDFRCEQDFTYLKYPCTNNKDFIKEHFLLPHVIGHFGRNEFNAFSDSSIFQFQKSIDYVSDDLLMNEMTKETCDQFNELYSFLGFLWFIKDHSITVSSTTAATSDPTKKCFSCSGGVYYSTMDCRSQLTTWSIDEINKAYAIHSKVEEACKTLATRQPLPEFNNDPIQVKERGPQYEDKDINRIERMIKFWGFMRGQDDAITKLSLCIPILECLFSNSNTDITFQVAMRVANYSSSTQEERKRIFTLVKEVYNIRSQFFHGDVVTKTTAEVKDYCLQMDALLRTVMTKVIMTDSEIFLQDKKKMKEFYEDLLF